MDDNEINCENSSSAVEYVTPRALVFPRGPVVDTADIAIAALSTRTRSCVKIKSSVWCFPVDDTADIAIAALCKRIRSCAKIKLSVSIAQWPSRYWDAREFAFCVDVLSKPPAPTRRWTTYPAQSPTLVPHLGLLGSTICNPHCTCRPERRRN